MAIHWQVTFKTLRGGKTLNASVYDNLYSGQPIQLKGGAEPFVTNENNDDDPFKAIRTQTGSLKIVDDGYALDGVTPFNWRDLQPRSDHDRPVILTDENDTILWQGFLQAQNFSGTLYEQTQEREFPLQCPLSILSSQYPNTTDQGIVNFAFLLNYISSMVSAASVSVINFTEFIIQGGRDAQAWLSKKFHWANLLSENNENDIAPQYDLFTCLEDMCNFWGWEARTEGTRLYLMCTEDPTEQTALILTPSDLSTMAAGSFAGTIDAEPFVRRELTGNIFASNDNDDMWMNGPSEVSVKADCNEQSTAFQFAPKVVEDAMEAAGSYTWHHREGDDPKVGMFSTPMISSFDSGVMSGSSSTTRAGFRRMQIFSTPEADNPTLIDAFDFVNIQEQDSVKISIQTKRMMSFSKGTLKFSASVFKNAEVWDSEGNDDYLRVRIGIGETKESARWFSMSVDRSGNITHGWSSTVQGSVLTIGNGDIKGLGLLFAVQTPLLVFDYYTFKGIPTDDYMHGYIFVDFCGIVWDFIHQDTRDFTVGNFKIEYSREKTVIPANIYADPRPREIKKDRVSQMDYKSINENSIKNEQSIDLVYASDNNMKFGFGLVMNPSYDYMATAYYGEALQHPEQHLADRIVNFWAAAKRLVTADLQTQMVEQSAPITPLSHLVLGQTHFRTLAISHQWRDDVTTLKMIQSLILLDDEEEVEETVEEES